MNLKVQVGWGASISGELANWIASVIFILIGGLFCLGIPRLIEMEMAKKTVHAKATVVSFYQNGDGLYYPNIQFSLPSGRITQFSSDTGSKPPVFRQGDVVEVVYEPENPGEFAILGENKLLLTIFSIIGYTLLFFGGFIFVLTVYGVYIKVKMPQNKEVWTWWVGFIGGILGALLFSLPSTFIFYLFRFFPEQIRNGSADNQFILWIFTIVGIGVDIGTYFLAKHFYKNRPRWKNDNEKIQ